MLDKVSLDGDELYRLEHVVCRKMQSPATCDLRPAAQRCNVCKNLVLGGNHAESSRLCVGAGPGRAGRSRAGCSADATGASYVADAFGGRPGGECRPRADCGG